MATPNTRPNPYIGPRSFETGERLYGRDFELGTLLNLLIAERIVLLHSPSGAGKSSLIQAGLIPLLEERGFNVLPPVRINLEPPAGLRGDPFFNRFIYSALASLQEKLPEGQRSSVAALAQMTLADCLERCSFLSDGGNQDGGASEVLIFDQFEEILTIEPTRRGEKAAFFTQLGSILRSKNRWALFAIREDYLAALGPYLRPVPTRLRTTFRLDLLGEEAACQAIQWPARESGVDFTDEAVTQLVDNLRRVQVQRPDGSMEEQLGPYVEPVQLQVVCYRLWDHLSTETDKILPEDLEAVGDVDRALGDYYSERVNAASAEAKTSERAIRDWFEHKLITPQGIRGQVLMGSEQSEGLSNQAIRLLENAHLVRAEKRGGATWFELAHDRLIKPVQTSNSAWFAANLTLLQRQAAVWETEHRPESLLLRDKDLEEAESWAQANLPEMTDIERNFLEVCRELRRREEEARKLSEAQQTAATERQRAELEARSAQKLRRLAIIIAGALVLAVITTIAAGFFWQDSAKNAQTANMLRETSDYVAGVNQVFAATNEAAAATAQRARGIAEEQQKIAEAASTQESYQRSTAEAASALANAQKATAEFNAGEASRNATEAQTQANLAFSRQLASQSHGYLSSQNDLSLLLAVEAYRTSDTVEAQSALLNGIQLGLAQVAQPFGLPIPPEDNAIVSVALSPDGERLAFGSGEGVVVLWNYATGAIEHRYNVHKDIVWDLAFSPDGKTIATAGNDSSIHLLDIASGKTVGSINTNNKVSSVTWDPNGGRLAAGVGPRVMAWNLSDLKTPIFDQNLQVDVNGVAWSPDGAAIAAATNFPSVSILDPNTGIVNLNLTEGLTRKVDSVAWSPDGRILASGSADNLVHVWDVAKGRAATAPLKGHFNEVTSVAINHDKTILASGSKDGKIILWDLRTFKPFGPPLEVNSSDVNDLAFLPVSGRNLLASASRDKTAKLLEMITQQPLLASLASLSGQVMSISADPNDALTAAALQETTLSTWNVRGGIQNPALPAKVNTLSAALSHDGRLIAVGNDSGGIEVFDQGSGSLLQSIDTQSDQVTALAISPDGQTLAAGICNGAGISGNLFSCKDSQVQFWEISSGNSIGEPILGLNDFIFALAYSPDGKTLATGGQDKTLNLWSTSSGEQVGLPMTRHLDSVTSLAFSPDGRILASGSQDNSLILWDIATNQPIGEPLVGSPGSALSLAFNPTGKLLYAGYPDGTILAWDTDFQAWAQRACGLAGRNLTAPEWSQFFRAEGIPYRSTCDQYASSLAGESASTPVPSSAPTPTPTTTP